MVRALPFRTPVSLDFGRVVALAAAIALHLIALLLLLVPMAAPQLAPTIPKNDRTPIPLIKEDVPVTPLPPDRVKPKPVETKVEPKPSVAPPTPIEAHPQIVDYGTLPATEGPVVAPSNDIGPVDTSPMVGSQLQYVTAPPPPYPGAEQRRGIEGTVMLRILVDVDGRPLEVVVDASSGNRNLDRVASQHVLKHWRFKPAVRDGVTVQAYGLVPITFALR
jgi:protein TonB